MAAGAVHTVALRPDGSVIAWGQNVYGQTNVPPDLSNVMAIAAGYYHSFALRPDGSVVQWGNEPAWVHNGTVSQVGTYGYHYNDAPSMGYDTPMNVVAMAASGKHATLLVNDGSPRVVQNPLDRIAYSGDTVTLLSGIVSPAAAYQWQFNGANIEGPPIPCWRSPTFH